MTEHEYELIDEFLLPYCDGTGEVEEPLENQETFTGFQVIFGRDPEFQDEPEVSLCFFRDGDCTEAIGLTSEATEELIEFLKHTQEDY